MMPIAIPCFILCIISVVSGGGQATFKSLQLDFDAK